MSTTEALVARDKLLRQLKALEDARKVLERELLDKRIEIRDLEKRLGS